MLEHWSCCLLRSIRLNLISVKFPCKSLHNYFCAFVNNLSSVKPNGDVFFCETTFRFNGWLTMLCLKQREAIKKIQRQLLAIKKVELIYPKSHSWTEMIIKRVKMAFPLQEKSVSISREKKEREKERERKRMKKEKEKEKQAMVTLQGMCRGQFHKLFCVTVISFSPIINQNISHTSAIECLQLWLHILKIWEKENIG